MEFEYISDGSGNPTAVRIPIAEWNEIRDKLNDLKALTSKEPHKKNNASRFKGLLTNEEADKYHKYLKKARSEWNRDI